MQAASTIIIQWEDSVSNCGLIWACIRFYSWSRQSHKDIGPVTILLIWWFKVGATGAILASVGLAIEGLLWRTGGYHLTGEEQATGRLASTFSCRFKAVPFRVENIPRCSFNKISTASANKTVYFSHNLRSFQNLMFSALKLCNIRWCVYYLRPAVCVLCGLLTSCSEICRSRQAIFRKYGALPSLGLWLRLLLWLAIEPCRNPDCTTAD